MDNNKFKNGFQVNEVPWEIYMKQKKNQVFKLLPLREEGQDWQKQIKTILIEIGGVIDLSPQEEAIAITIMSKLAGLGADSEVPFQIYRKTIFEIISLLDNWKKVG